MPTFLQQIEAKDWFLFALGSGVTILLAMLGYLREYLRQYAQITPLLGEWHSYHFSRANHSLIFMLLRAVFKRSLFGLKMYVTDNKTISLVYKGRVFFEAGHVVITGEGISHKETWHARFSDPIPTERTMMVGIQLSQDFDREMFATVELCTKNEITEDEAKAILAKYARLLVQEHSLRLRRDLSG